MSWFILILAGLLEICWAILLKYTNGFNSLLLSTCTLMILLFSIILLAIAMKELPVGTAYTVWTGIGVIGTVIIGILFFGESASLSKLCCFGLIISGILGIKMIS
ncbi:DMT family transporter [Legionella israelensis]|uniref:Guanidinium exporter n=1 Tax=Legionella israelensis TaxID=454 RepID=A0A0W0VIU2_9GAMM|nr:SMR family transporter [Legionella israelensis]KTD20037.1 GroEL suppressor SugE [Legionella israelensis]QBS09118.1 QacE family quaternary ammonium compound efflux SMR transporter [Legionella israelensis]SCY50261.1 quaternary ammonium compound-resistance protein SugE [Legionella israelensis DSM 19235]STX58847.1 suppressor of GroEL [Legionella israelensis]